VSGIGHGASTPMSAYLDVMYSNTYAALRQMSASTASSEAFSNCLLRSVEFRALGYGSCQCFEFLESLGGTRTPDVRCVLLY
jgi:hypothetical protein